MGAPNTKSTIDQRLFRRNKLKEEEWIGILEEIISMLAVRFENSPQIPLRELRQFPVFRNQQYTQNPNNLSPLCHLKTPIPFENNKFPMQEGHYLKMHGMFFIVREQDGSAKKRKFWGLTRNGNLLEYVMHLEREPRCGLDEIEWFKESPKRITVQEATIREILEFSGEHPHQIAIWLTNSPIEWKLDVKKALEKIEDACAPFESLLANLEGYLRANGQR